MLCSDEEDALDDDVDEQIAVAATTFGISAFIGSGKTGSKSSGSPGRKGKGHSPINADKDRLNVDITALKQQYSKLRQRQKQAQIILTTAWTKQTPGGGGSTPATTTGAGQLHPNRPAAMNHLLLGKKPLVASKPRRGPPPGAVPPRSKHNNNTVKSGIEANKVLKPTHISRPQPEVVSPSEQRKKPNNNNNLSRSKKSSESAEQVNEAANDNRSSSTELCVEDEEDVTENATDIEDIPKDPPPSKDKNRQFLEELIKDFDEETTASKDVEDEINGEGEELNVYLSNVS